MKNCRRAEDRRLPRGPGADRGQSEVIGTLLMVAVVVVLAGLIAVPLISIVEDVRNPAPNTLLNVTASGTNTTVVHDGGDTLSLDELTLVVETTSSEVQIPLDDPDSVSEVDAYTTPADGDLTVQDRLEIQMDNDVQRSIVVDTGSGAIIGSLDD